MAMLLPATGQGGETRAVSPGCPTPRRSSAAPQGLLGRSRGYGRVVSSDLSWLPDQQIPVVSTLAHADDLIGRVGELVLAHTRDGGAIELHDVHEAGLVHVRVAGVRPLARAIALYTADALTTLRAAVEHALFAEVETATKRPLTETEQRSVEMPAHETAAAFDKWVRDRKKNAPPPLQAGSKLLDRVRTLQPYRRQDPAEHPLRVLAAHTNLAKHRMPAVTATQVSRVHSWDPAPGLVIPPPTAEPVQVGQALASIPRGHVVPLDIWPSIAIHRPHTGEWKLLVDELDYISDWVRRVAIPVLVTGGHDAVDPPPAAFATDLGHLDERAAIAAGTRTSARERGRREIAVEMARQSLPEILAMHPTKPDQSMLEAWARRLDDEQLLERLGQLEIGTSYEAAQHTMREVSRMVAEARAAVGAELTPDP